MFDLIIIIFIIYIIVKRSKAFNVNSIALLKMHNFQNITLLKKTISSNFFTAQKADDNYLIQAMTPGNLVSKSTITELTDLAQKGHYHNMILIPSSSAISDMAKKEIENNHIQILKLDAKISSDESVKQSSFIPKMPLDDNCPIDEPQDAIQDGRKANSIFGNFFGNKIERL